MHSSGLPNGSPQGEKASNDNHACMAYALGRKRMKANACKLIFKKMNHPVKFAENPFKMVSKTMSVAGDEKGIQFWTWNFGLGILDL